MRMKFNNKYLYGIIVLIIIILAIILLVHKKSPDYILDSSGKKVFPSEPLSSPERDDEHFDKAIKEDNYAECYFITDEALKSECIKKVYTEEDILSDREIFDKAKEDIDFNLCGYILNVHLRTNCYRVVKKLEE